KDRQEQHGHGHQQDADPVHPASPHAGDRPLEAVQDLLEQGVLGGGGGTRLGRGPGGGGRDGQETLAARAATPLAGVGRVDAKGLLTGRARDGDGHGSVLPQGNGKRMRGLSRTATGESTAVPAGASSSTRLVPTFELDLAQFTAAGCKVPPWA